MKLGVLRSGLARKLVLFALYSLVLTMSLWLAYELRFDFRLEPGFQGQRLAVLLWLVPLKLLLLMSFRQFHGLLSYFSIPDALRLVYAMGIASLVALLAWNLGSEAVPPRGVVLADLVISLAGLTGIRVFFRVLRERVLRSDGHENGQARRVAILGAGDVGASLVKELLGRRGLGFKPILFLDDDPQKWHARIHDVPVVGPPEKLPQFVKDYDLEEAIIAMPSAPPWRIKQLVDILHRARLNFETVPSLHQLATGKVRVTQLRSVEIQDLLGRDPVSLENEDIRAVLEGRIVAVTGAGGSIGSELCRQIAAFAPAKLLLVEQSEVQLFQIEQELIGLGYAQIIVPVVADIYDGERMRMVFDMFHPDAVFHAAAHKHVPMMERQPSEALKNNTLATVTLGELALEYEVERFVLISTDKAINPTSVMGASKRLAEIFIQALHASRPDGTKFMAVRFGNVLGSSGSVIPIFTRQIEEGGPVTVTHPEMTRYFMTIPEAAGLVLQSAAQGSGGEIFVLDMGEPVKIVDLARQLIELNGLRPDEDIAIEFTGVRPGEKLFEELTHTTENTTPTHHKKILRLIGEPLPLKEVRHVLERITAKVHTATVDELKVVLNEAVPEYRPDLTKAKGIQGAPQGLRSACSSPKPNPMSTIK